MSRMRIVTVILALVAAMTFASSASAGQYGYTIPGGLPTSSPQAALKVALDFAENNSEYAAKLQKQAGATGSFSRKDYKAKGWSHNAEGTLTTATDMSSGNIVAMPGDSKVLTVVAVNIKTGGQVKIMVKCGQLRVTFMSPVKVKKISKSKKIRVKKLVKFDQPYICAGTGQKIQLIGSTLVSGWVTIKGKITVKSVAAQVTAYISGKVNLKVVTKIKALCGPVPPPPPGNPPPPQFCPSGSHGGFPNCVKDRFHALAISTAYASAICADGTSAEASGSGYGEAWSDESQDDADHKAKAIADAVAASDAQARVHCAPVQPPPPPPPPAKTHAYLTKAAYVDGAMVTLSGGEFTFSKIVNGGSSTSLTNPASNQSKDLGEFEVGDSVQVCETNSAGYIPDEPCITHTFTTAGEKFTFAFVNRKTSPPPPPPSCQSQGTCPKPGLSITEVNDLDTGQQYDYYCATAQLPAGHTGTMRMSVKYGHWGSRTGSIQFKLTGGTQTFCATIADGTVLTAPKEVPSSGTDTVTVSATDDTYQSSISDSTTYNVQEPRTNPA